MEIKLEEQNATMTIHPKGTADSLIRHNAKIGTLPPSHEPGYADYVNIHGAECIHEKWEGGNKVRCGRPVAMGPGVPHGWLCPIHLREQDRIS